MRRLLGAGPLLCLALACMRPAPSGPGIPPGHGGAAPMPNAAAPAVYTAERRPPRVHGANYAAEAGLGAPLFQQGKATYYHDSLAGNHTASGEIYDPRLLSAAHRTLPFGTIVDVVRSDGRWVRVRINDRGPYGRGRVIDLSRAAAELVGLDRAGIADVTIYLVERPAALSRN